MSKLPMKRIEVFGLKSNRKSILEALQRFGVVEPVSADLSENGFSKMNTVSSASAFLKAENTLSGALDILEKYSPENVPMLSIFSGKNLMTVSQYYETVENSDRALSIAHEITALDKNISECTANIAKIENEIISLEPWLDLDIPLDFKGTKKTVVHIGIIPDNFELSELLIKYNNHLLNDGKAEDIMMAAEFKILHSEPGKTYLAVFSRRESKQEVEAILRSMGFSRPSYISSKIPQEETMELNNRIKQSRDMIENNTKRIVQLTKHRALLKFMVDYYAMRTEKYRVLGDLNQRSKFFVFQGYIPEKYTERIFSELIRKYNAAVEIYDIAEDEQPPVLLKNNPFSEPVETVLETYSMPNKFEIDPTFIMSLFYYFLFGLMLSDAGYGLIMIIVCGFSIMKYPDMSPGLKKSLKMFFYCGISTLFWGVMFGGYFGDAIQVISTIFFGKTIGIPPLWFEPIKDPMRMLMFSFAVGIVHIFAGLGIKFYQSVKLGDTKSAIYDVVFWYLLVGGAIIYLMSTRMFVDMAGLKFKISSGVGNAAAICAGVGAVGIVLFGGRSSHNPAKRLAKGLYELYGITSYLSDILSYSRLLALGLATGVIAQVFNQMGSMFGSGIIGMILFAVVFIVGHTLNMGINLLGAYVHTNRLQFVEFFGKFYEGGGEKFKPFSANTKYFKFKEE